MNEIYWLTRVGVIGDVCEVLSIIGIIVFILYLIFAPLIYDTVDDKSHLKKFFHRWGAIAMVIWVISILGVLFVPTRKEMFAIYGIGTTIDYIKSNDKAKEFPDKAIDALDKYLDGLTEEKEE